ncbi:DUF6116 family protein [Lysobacter xanthus]
MTRLMLAPLMRWASRLRHPTLFWITAALFVLDVLIPDFIPLADELLLGLGTMLLANWRRRGEPPAPTTRR